MTNWMGIFCFGPHVSIPDCWGRRRSEGDKDMEILGTLTSSATYSSYLMDRGSKPWPPGLKLVGLSQPSLLLCLVRATGQYFTEDTLLEKARAQQDH